MSFENSLLSWFIPVTAVVLTIVIALDATRRRRALEKIGDPRTLDRMTQSLSVRRRVIKSVLLVLSLTLLVTALAGPTVPGSSTWRQRGIDVAVLIDFSKSMLAQDVYPSRLGAAQREADAIVGSLEADRVSMIVFAGAAIHFPLTHDHRAATLLYSGISPADLVPGSNIGEAFRVARCTLRPDVVDESCQRIGGRGRGGDPLAEGEDLGDVLVAELPQISDRARAIVIFTDGEETAGSAAVEQLEAAIHLGIDVFIVGVGTLVETRIPELDEEGREIGWKEAADGSFVRTRLDQESLVALAELAGGEGHYFSLGPDGMRRDDLTNLLERLKKGDLDERVVHQPRHVYQIFLFPAFLLLILEACIGERRRIVSSLAVERRE